MKLKRYYKNGIKTQFYVVVKSIKSVIFADLIFRGFYVENLILGFMTKSELARYCFFRSLWYFRFEHITSFGCSSSNNI